MADKKEQTKNIKRKFFSVADTQINPVQTDLLTQIKEIEGNARREE